MTRHYSAFDKNLHSSDLRAEIGRIRALIHAHPRGDYLLKLAAVLLVLQGVRLGQVARWFQITPPTIKKWYLKQTSHQGIDKQSLTLTRGHPKGLHYEEELKAYKAFLANPAITAKDLKRLFPASTFDPGPSLRSYQRLLRRFRASVKSGDASQI
jgi:transposase